MTLLADNWRSFQSKHLIIQYNSDKIFLNIIYKTIF